MAPKLNGKPPVITPGSLILVTGANGYIASHVVDQLLEAGYKVRGTVRDPKKSSWMHERFDKKYGSGNFEIAVVEDMTAPDAFDEATKGVAGVAHVASVLLFSEGDPHKVIPPVIAGALNALTAAAKTPSVKRLVYTSSSTALTSPKPDKVFSIDANSWNQEDVNVAWKAPPYEASRAYSVYCASKTQAEQEVWKFVKEKKPPFVVNTVLPSANFGGVFTEQQSASTGAWITALYNAGTEFPDYLAAVPPQWMINVSDTARLHVAALVDPEVENERILGFAEPYNWNDILAILRKLCPEKSFPEDLKDCPRDKMQVSIERGAELLRKFGREGWTGLEESVGESIALLRK